MVGLSLARSFSLKLIKQGRQLHPDLLQAAEPGFIDSFARSRLIGPNVYGLQILHLMLETGDSLQDVLCIHDCGIICQQTTIGCLVSNRTGRPS
jgi:hypothetical protein